jgi:superfamily II DNA or RNA helicase
MRHVADDLQAGSRVMRPTDGKVGTVVRVVGQQAEVQFASDPNPVFVSIASLVARPLEWRVHDVADLSRHLLSLKFDKPLRDNLYAVSASRARFEAHQFKPALKFFESARQRLLIADEVGLGKTIEAGIIYAELNARNTHPLERVLVVCPSGLKEKWKDELFYRFGEEFVIADAPELKKRFDNFRRGQGRLFKLIVPLESIRAREFSETIGELAASHGFAFDFTVIDEAHHLRNPLTQSHHIAETIAENSDSLLLLTATPVQLGSADLFHLLSLLDEELFPSLDVFRETIEPNRYVNELISCLRARDMAGARRAVASLKQNAKTQHFAGSPFMARVEAFLAAPSPGPREVGQAVDDAKELHTLAGLFTRTRKKEVGRAAERDARVLRVRLSAEELAYYRAVGKYTRQLARARGFSPSWGVISRERQAASCIPASVEYFAATLSGEDDDGVEGWLTNAPRGPLPDDVRTLRDLVKLGRGVRKDSKVDEFLHAIRRSLAEKPTRKILVFSFFKRTLRYLRDQLAQAGITALHIDGDVKPVERAGRIRQFKDGSIPVLLSSEVGAEGLDFQFCDTIVNYDLPWNPMRVEQRIGRLDRYGQVSPKITIISFVLGDTIEERILERLYDRIGVFRESIGELEPILGDIVAKLERDVFRAELTPAQELQMARSLEDAIAASEGQLRTLSARFDEFLGNDDLINQVEERQQRGLTITAGDIRDAVEHVLPAYTSALTPVAQRDGVFELRKSAALANALHHLRSDRRFPWTEEHADFARRLGIEDVWVIFDGDIAIESPRVPFVGLGHPLARLAIAAATAERAGLEKVPIFRVMLPLPDEYTSHVHLFVFRFHHTGGIEGFRLFPILAEEGRDWLTGDPAWRIFGRLRNGKRATITLDDPDAYALLESEAILEAAREKEALLSELEDRTDTVILARKASVGRNLQVRMDKRLRWAQEAPDPRIRRMRLAEAANIEGQLDEELRRLDSMRHVEVDFELVLRVMVENDREPFA